MSVRRAKKQQVRAGRPGMSGQAMLETLLVTVLVTIMVFASIQLCLVSINDLISNEAVFSALRAGIVATENEADSRIASAAFITLTPHVSLHNVNYVFYRITNRRRDIGTSHANRPVTAYTCNLSYGSSIMFGRLFNPSKGFPLGKTPVLNNTSRAQLVKSPDEEYYTRAYPGANAFSQ